MGTGSASNDKYYSLRQSGVCSGVRRKVPSGPLPISTQCQLKQIALLHLAVLDKGIAQIRCRPAIMSSDAMACSAFHSNGQPCECTRYTKRHKDDNCICKHSLRKHGMQPAATENKGKAKLDHVPMQAPASDKAKGKERTVDSLHDAFEARVAKLMTTGAKVESNAGFRPKARAASGSSGAAAQSQKPKGRAVSDSAVKIGNTSKSGGSTGKTLRVGIVAFLPCGLNESGSNLALTKYPCKALLENYRRYGLVVDEGPDGQELSFPVDMDQEEADNQLHNLFPNVFAFLDGRFGSPKEGEYHWVLVGKDYAKAYIYARSLEFKLRGGDFAAARGGAGRNIASTSLVFASRHLIPSKAYRNWEAALDNPLSDEFDIGNDAFGWDMPKKSKPKRRVVVESDEEEEDDDDENDDDNNGDDNDRYQTEIHSENEGGEDVEDGSDSRHQSPILRQPPASVAPRTRGAVAGENRAKINNAKNPIVLDLDDDTGKSDNNNDHDHNNDNAGGGEAVSGLSERASKRKRSVSQSDSTANTNDVSQGKQDSSVPPPKKKHKANVKLRSAFKWDLDSSVAGSSPIQTSTSPQATGICHLIAYSPSASGDSAVRSQSEQPTFVFPTNEGQIRSQVLREREASPTPASKATTSSTQPRMFPTAARPIFDPWA
ncbi:hypothetical protein BKA70DRAFT_503764 [Coprinopsis sp. MPI-PUGE-AT-0042]|nr:hypothetical protein BKA70DRAFT_503764 [Coprinopsis sp. MPI-PUGE-AT-0042]